MRPEWYLYYVKNLAWLLSIRYKIDQSKLDYKLFKKMVDFSSVHKCSMKGIIDYEIAKIRGKRIVYIPVFYSSPNRAAASLDALFNTDYLTGAKSAKDNTIKYMQENGVTGTVEELKGNVKISFVTEDFFYSTKAFKITF